MCTRGKNVNTKTTFEQIICELKIQKYNNIKYKVCKIYRRVLCILKIAIIGLSFIKN